MIDRDFILRYDSTGHRPRDDTYTVLKAIKVMRTFSDTA